MHIKVWCYPILITEESTLDIDLEQQPSNQSFQITPEILKKLRYFNKIISLINKIYLYN